MSPIIIGVILELAGIEVIQLNEHENSGVYRMISVNLAGIGWLLMLCMGLGWICLRSSKRAEGSRLRSHDCA